MSRRASLALFALMLGAGAGACDGPDPRELFFDLVTPNSDDGAIHFAITATPGYDVMDLEAACAGCRIFTRTVDERQTLGLVTGPIVAGEFLRAIVSEGGRPRAVTVTIVQVASRTYELRALSGYSVSVTR